MRSLPTISEGDQRHEVVRRAQALVNAALHTDPPIAEDGAFGPRTVQRIEVVQHQHGLHVDGIVGPVTWTVLVTGAI